MKRVVIVMVADVLVMVEVWELLLLLHTAFDLRLNTLIKLLY